MHCKEVIDPNMSRKLQQFIAICETPLIFSSLVFEFINGCFTKNNMICHMPLSRIRLHHAYAYDFAHFYLTKIAKLEESIVEDLNV